MSDDADRYARARREVAHAPRAELRAVLDAPAPVPWLAPSFRAAAVRAGAPRRVVDAWAAVELHRGAAITAGPDDAGEAVRVWWAAVDETRAWLRPTRGEAPPRDVGLLVKRAAEAAESCGRCGSVWWMEGGGGDEARLLPSRCNRRACLECTRRRLRRVIDRWAPLFGAPPRPGYRLSFVTIGSTRPVRDRADIRRYLRGVGTLLKMMRRGVPSYGIPARAWVAGVRALELLPRERPTEYAPGGGFGHVHLAVMRSDFYPYGLHEKALPAHPHPEQLGMRALLRALGLGEVFRDDRVTTTGDGARAVATYMSKVARYITKVCRDEDEAAAADTARALTWDGRLDLQETMRGARLLEPFGDARGLLGGPDKVRLWEHGARLRWGENLGLYDPTRPETWGVLDALPEGGPLVVGGLSVEDMTVRPETRRVERVTIYRGDTLWTWDTWADVGALRRGMLTPAVEEDATP